MKTTSADQVKLGYVPALDGLRAIAAIAVVAFHVRLPGALGGFIGVDIFFVLSGFLITALIRKEFLTTGSFKFGKFWAKRLFRLFPAMLVVLIAVAVLYPLLSKNFNFWNEFVSSSLYISNYTRPLFGIPTVTQHTWSLAVEMQFYLLWPFVVLVLSRTSTRNAIIALLTLYCVVTFWRGFAFESFGWRRAYYPLDTRITGLIAGAVLAFGQFKISPRWAALVTPVALLYLIYAGASMDFYNLHAATWGGVSVELAAALLIVCILHKTWFSSLLSHPWLVSLGVWSYSIYLWHYPIARLARAEFNPLLAFGVTLTLSIALAALTYHFVEKRFAKIRSSA